MIHGESVMPWKSFDECCGSWKFPAGLAALAELNWPGCSFWQLRTDAVPQRCRLQVPDADSGFLELKSCASNMEPAFSWQGWEKQRLANWSGIHVASPHGRQGQESKSARMPWVEERCGLLHCFFWYLGVGMRIGVTGKLSSQRMPAGCHWCGEDRQREDTRISPARIHQGYWASHTCAPFQHFIRALLHACDSGDGTQPWKVSGEAL